MKGKCNVDKVRINFLERAHPVFGCEFCRYFGKQHNFERGKKLRKMYLSTGWEGRTGKLLARGHTSAYYPVRPDQTQSMNILPLSVQDFEIFVLT